MSEDFHEYYRVCSFNLNIQQFSREVQINNCKMQITLPTCSVAHTQHCTQYILYASRKNFDSAKFCWCLSKMLNIYNKPNKTTTTNLNFHYRSVHKYHVYNCSACAVPFSTAIPYKSDKVL